MLTAPQVFDITHLISFYYGVTWSLDRRNLFNWKDEEPGNFEQKLSPKELEDLVQYLYENSAAGEGQGGGKSQG